MFSDTYQDRLGSPIYQDTVFPHFPSTKVQYFLTSHLPRYSISPLPIYQGILSPHRHPLCLLIPIRTDRGFPSTKVQYFLTSHLPRYSISSLPIYQGTVFPHFPATKVHYFLTSCLPGYNVSSQSSFVFTDVLSGQTGVSHQPRYSISSQPSLDCIDTLSACQDRLGFPIYQGTMTSLHAKPHTLLCVLGLNLL